MKLLSKLYKNISILEWDPSINYKLNAIVTYKGQLYKSFSENNKGEVPVTSKNWISIK